MRARFFFFILSFLFFVQTSLGQHEHHSSTLSVKAPTTKKVIKKNKSPIAGIRIKNNDTQQKIKERHIKLIISYKMVRYAGKWKRALAINNQIPAPTLHFKEGERVNIEVYNHLNEGTSLHWHGILLPWQMDGVENISQKAIPPGGVFHYQFTLHQSGTYWYHAHAGVQEQEGLYGAFLIDPKAPPPFNYSKDHVIVLSDWSNIPAEQIFKNLKKDGDYFSPNFPLQPSLTKFLSDYHTADNQERKSLWDDYLMMQKMRMSIYDLSDVAYDAFLLNGHTKIKPWKAIVQLGDTVRLRFIGAGASTIFRVKIYDTSMQLVHAQGNDITPLTIKSFDIAPGETYDVLVKITKNTPYIIYAESIDKVGTAIGALLTSSQQRIDYKIVPPFPEPLPVSRQMMQTMMMKDQHQMHSSHPMLHSKKEEGTKSASVAHAGHNLGGKKPSKSSLMEPSHLKHQKGLEKHVENQKSDHEQGHHSQNAEKEKNTLSLDYIQAKTVESVMRLISSSQETTTQHHHSKTHEEEEEEETGISHHQHPNHHTSKKQVRLLSNKPTKEVSHKNNHPSYLKPNDTLVFSDIEPMIMRGHEHSNGKGHSMPIEPSIIGDTIIPMSDSIARTRTTGTKYQDLRSVDKTNNPNTPVDGVIRMELFGYMDRFIWFINGLPEYKAKPILMKPGKRYRIIFTNNSMMRHPMHMHGHWFILRNGNGAYDPLLHTLNVPPGATAVADVDTDASGQWFFHCHHLYHMMSGMARVFQYQTIIEVVQGLRKPENNVAATDYYNRPIVRVDEQIPIDKSLVIHPVGHHPHVYFASFLDIATDPFKNTQRFTYLGLYGPDYHKLQLFANDAELSKGKVERADIDIFYWRQISQFWAVKGGINYFYKPAFSPYWQPGIGIEGTLPYFITTNLRSYLYKNSAKLDLELLRDTQITNNLFFRLGIRSILASKTIFAAGLGSGLNQMQYLIGPYYRLAPGISLTAEFEREQAYGPYKSILRSLGQEPNENTLTLGVSVLF